MTRSKVSGAVKDFLLTIAEEVEVLDRSFDAVDDFEDIMDWASAYRGDMFRVPPQDLARDFLKWRNRRHRYAFLPGVKDPNGWDPGKITSERIYHNEGSQTPIPHDRDGNPVEVEGEGLMKIPGYEWHDKSPEFHRMAKRLASRYLKK